VPRSVASNQENAIDVFGSDLMAMQRTSNNKKNKKSMSGQYARTEEELYRKAIELLDKCKVEDRR
jgi:hypothetical protein